VAAEAERAVDGEFAGLEGEHVENLGHHDGAVGAGRGFAGGEHLGNVGGVTFRV